MNYPKNKITIVVLNYNGWQDTVECLLSIAEIKQSGYSVILIDNASADDSVVRIVDGVAGKFNTTVLNEDDVNTNFSFHDTPSIPDISASCPSLLFVKNTDNVGFAAGCNQGMQLALAAESEYIWLLNNDTVLEPDSLSLLVDFLDTHKAYHAVTPQIRLHGAQNIIWNCGGELTWYGMRRYYFVNKDFDTLPACESLDITFVTGCALLVRAKLVQEMEGFTEDFFFGEEDFDFSLRMKKNKRKMACCLPSIIYHKVGATIDRSSKGINVNKAYIHYLNRFLNIRNHWRPVCWKSWRLLYVFYIYYLLGVNNTCSLSLRYRFVRKLLKESSTLHKVDKDCFHKIINAGVGYFKI